MGEWKHTAGEIGADKGIQTSPDARFFSLTAPLDSEVKNDGKDLVVSYTVRHDQNIDCGGAYLKVSNIIIIIYFYFKIIQSFSFSKIKNPRFKPKVLIFFQSSFLIFFIF